VNTCKVFGLSELCHVDYLEWGVSMRKLILWLVLIQMTLFLTGCGETVSGMGKDLGRMGKGTRTFFFKET